MEKERICNALVSANVVRFGEFTLVSGEKSPIYIDLRILPSFVGPFNTITDALVDKCREIKPAVIAGAETAGISLATAVAMKMQLPMVYVRKDKKDYGTKSLVEGVIQQNDKVVLIDDLITNGKSKLQFLEAIRRADGVVKDVSVILDREQGGEEFMMKHNLNLHSLISLKDVLSYMLDKERIGKAQYSSALVYLSGMNRR